MAGGGKREPGALRVHALCRGEGLGYVLLSAEKDVGTPDVRAQLADGTPVPAELYAVDRLGWAELGMGDVRVAAVFVAVLPLVARDVRLEVVRPDGSGAVLGSVTFPALGSKLSSRLLTAVRPQVAAALRGYERRHGHGRCTVRICEAWPADGGTVAWRVQVTYPTDDAAAAPVLRAYDEQAQAVDARVVLMEDHVVPSARDERAMVRMVTFSCVMPERVVAFYVVAGLDEDGQPPEGGVPHRRPARDCQAGTVPFGSLRSPKWDSPPWQSSATSLPNGGCPAPVPGTSLPNGDRPALASEASQRGLSPLAGEPPAQQSRATDACPPPDEPPSGDNPFVSFPHDPRHAPAKRGLSRFGEQSEPKGTVPFGRPGSQGGLSPMAHFVRQLGTVPLGGRPDEPPTSPQGFDGMNAPRALGMLGHTRLRTNGAATDPAYAQWFATHRATSAELARQREACAQMPADDKPLMSIVMPVFRTPEAFFSAAVESVLAQSYDRWELVVVNASGPCAEVEGVLARVRDERVRVIEVENRSIADNTNAGIAAAHGDYVGFLDHDDLLEPNALWCYAQAIAECPETDLLYCDEDRLADGQVRLPAFKTFPNYGKLYAHNYVTHFLMVSRRALDLTERSAADVAGAQDYDLTLKVFEVARAVRHVPRVLYHWREHAGSTAGGADQKPFAHEAGRRALAAHLTRRGIAARVDDGALTCTYRVRYELPTPAPLVSVVIPTRDQAALLEACVSSILDKTTYPSFEVVLVENNSADERTFALYRQLQERDERVRVVAWEPPEPGAFNYSAVVNFGVAQSAGELVVLLNNDTEVIEPAWLEEMAGCLMRSEVGVVGAKLLFGDGLIQHVGMVATPQGDFCHVCQNLTRDALGPAFAAAMPGDYAMVTGACQMVSKALFDELGGYDEGLAVGFNDGDFCLRAGEAGRAVTVAPHALLYHREFSTRGREITDARLRSRYLQEKSRIIARHPDFFAQGDPVINPNLDGNGTYFELPSE